MDRRTSSCISRPDGSQHRSPVPGQLRGLRTWPDSRGLGGPSASRNSGFQRGSRDKKLAIHELCRMGVRFINIRCILSGDLLLSNANRVKAKEANGKYAHFQLKEWDIVVSTSGTLGRSAVVRRIHLPLLLNTSVIRFRPVDGITSFSYLYSNLNSPVFLDQLAFIGLGECSEKFWPYPSEEHARRMHSAMQLHWSGMRLSQVPFLKQAITNRPRAMMASPPCATHLLPKLVSGALRVTSNSSVCHNSICLRICWLPFWRKRAIVEVDLGGPPAGYAVRAARSGERVMVRSP